MRGGCRVGLWLLLLLRLLFEWVGNGVNWCIECSIPVCGWGGIRINFFGHSAAREGRFCVSGWYAPLFFLLCVCVFAVVAGDGAGDGHHDKDSVAEVVRGKELLYRLS